MPRHRSTVTPSHVVQQQQYMYMSKKYTHIMSFVGSYYHIFWFLLQSLQSIKHSESKNKSKRSVWEFQLSIPLIIAIMWIRSTLSSLNLNSKSLFGLSLSRNKQNLKKTKQKPIKQNLCKKMKQEKIAPFTYFLQYFVLYILFFHFVLSIVISRCLLYLKPFNFWIKKF